MTTSALTPAHVAAKFKTCSNCQEHWECLDAFAQDPRIELVGYMPIFDDFGNGLFLFNHDCGTTLACRVALFKHLYDGPLFQEKKRGEPECPGYCQNKTELTPCPVKCSCAFVREILQIIKRWPKSKAP